MDTLDEISDTLIGLVLGEEKKGVINPTIVSLGLVLIVVFILWQGMGESSSRMTYLFLVLLSNLLLLCCSCFLCSVCSVVSRIFRKKQQTSRVLLLGLCDSGKTALLSTLFNGNIKK